MRLLLDPSDLKEEHLDENGVEQECSTQSVTFEYLNDDAQAAVKMVGRGTFNSFNHQEHKWVLPPKSG